MEEKDLENCKDFYKNTRACIDEYNRVVNKALSCEQEITDDEEEELDNHSMYLAHALIKDFGADGKSRETLEKMCNIILSVLI